MIRPSVIQTLCIVIVSKFEHRKSQTTIITRWVWSSNLKCKPCKHCVEKKEWKRNVFMFTSCFVVIKVVYNILYTVFFIVCTIDIIRMILCGHIYCSLFIVSSIWKHANVNMAKVNTFNTKNIACGNKIVINLQTIHWSSKSFMKNSHTPTLFSYKSSTIQ